MSRKEKRRGGFGPFFCGSVVGFILCIALIAGVLAFAYYKVSPNWINKTFKTEIDLGSDEINDKTIKDFVNGAIGLVQNKDTYKLSNLKSDFGIEIKDELFGINITDLKDVAITDLGSAIEKKFGSISADELRNVDGMNLEEEMGDILNKTNTYYFNNDKLYKDSTYSEEVTFDYTINTAKTKVTTKGHETSIVSGEVSIELWYLPLTVALGDFTSNMGENITLYDLEQSYGVTLPNFIKLTEQQKKDTTINELDSAINDIVVKDILNLNIKSYEDSGKIIYYNDEDDDNIKDQEEEVVTYVLYSISEKKISELSSTINNFTISQIFSEDERTDGILSLLEEDATISEIPSEIQRVITTTNITTLKEKGVITLNSTDEAKLTVEIDHDNNSETAKVAVGSLTINQLFDYCFDLIPTI